MGQRQAHNNQQTPENTGPSIFPGFSAAASFTTGGLVIWIVWYGIVYTIPQIHEGFRQELSKERTVFESAIKQISTDLRDINESHERRMQKALDHISNNQKLTSEFQLRLIENQKLILDTLKDQQSKKGKEGSS